MSSLMLGDMKRIVMDFFSKEIELVVISIKIKYNIHIKGYG